MAKFSCALTISDHLVQLWTKNSIQRFLWKGSWCPSSRLRRWRR